MKRFFSLLSSILGLFCVFAQYVPPPQPGDFQSRTSGNWTSVSTWNVYNGTTWVAATSYPGQNTSATNQANYRVFVKAGDNVTSNVTQPLFFGDVYILSCIYNPVSGTCSGYPDSSHLSDPNVRYGMISINGTLRLLGNSQSIYIYGGTLNFPNNQTQLYLLTGNSLVITNYNGGIGSSAVYGTNGVQPVKSQDCSGQRRIYFQNSAGVVGREYAVCYAQSFEYTFQELNAQGGSLYAKPSVSSIQICEGQKVTLSGTYSGLIPTGKQVKYAWSYTGPVADNVITSQPNFNTNLLNVPVTPVDLMLPTAGSYTFTLKMQYPYDNADPPAFMISSQESVSVTVYPQNSAQCGCYKNPITNTSVTVPSKFGITSLGRAGSNGDNWPMQRQSAALVLESKTKGFVINTVTDTAAILNPTEGMMVFDSSARCVKVYTTTDNGASYSWKCMTTPGCPTN